MTCERCDEARARGDRFCPWCGEPLTEPEPERGHKGGLLRRITLWSVPFTVILLVIELAYLVGGILPTFEWCNDAEMDVLALVPVLISVGTLQDNALQAAWILIAAAILASVVWTVKKSYRTMKEDGDTVENGLRTDLRGISMLFCASLAASLIIGIILIDVGSGIESPDGLETGNTPAALLSYANAAVWEEVISRVVYIGVPMTVAALICHRGKDSLRNLLGGFGMSRLSLILIVVSAVVFGFAHMSGWGFEKVIPTTVSGLIIGYAYVRYGIHASICIHFLTDYLAVAAYTDLMVPVALLMWALVIVGFACLVYLVWNLRRLPADVRSMGWMPQDSSLSSRGRD